MAKNDLSIIENKKKFSDKYGKRHWLHLLIMTARRKLYYTSGVISLIGYLFLLPYAYNKSISKPIKAISFNVPRLPANESDFGYIFSTNWILKDIKNKKKIKFWLNDDHETNQEKINLIRFEARKMKYTFDSTSVIFIEFTNDLLYEELFKMYDNCITDKIQRFATWNNCFVIFGGYLPRPKNNDKFECFLCGDIIKIQNDPPKKSLIEKFSNLIAPFNVLQISGLITLWLIMIFTSILHRRKIIKNNFAY